MIYNGLDVEHDAAISVAKLMATAARTAPKGRGQDNIEVIILTGEEKDRLSATMRDIAAETDEDFFSRDAANVDNSHCVVVIGVRNQPLGLSHCGLCGFSKCSKMVKADSNCAFNITDLGIAIGSAVSIAADNRMDNRIMFSVGKGVLRLGFMPADVRVCYGIPLATRGKSIFYDRG